ncbi:MAG: ABC transporter permease, partial [Actinomycetota bacterium]|nr:ABC transporter permease [Actinomycetota bacterium]
MTDTASHTAPTTVRRYEWVAFEAIWVRELTLFRRYWASTTFSAIVQPTIYLLAFGLGVGTLITSINGLSYVEYVGTGTVAMAVLFASAFPGMFSTFVRRVFQRSYDALLAAPVDIEELVLAEGTWIAAKAGIFGSIPLVVTFFFGLTPTWGMLFVPFIAFLAGLGWAYFGMWQSTVVKTIDAFTYITSAVLTPLFLVAGTFFPISNLPPVLQALAQLNPLFHCVQL